jgi:hypothetical protein
MILIALALPAILFFVKNILPVLFNDFDKSRGKWVGVLVDFIHFPLDIIMVAISYTIPKTITNIYLWFGNSQKNPEVIKTAASVTVFNICFTILMAFTLPFVVALLKRAEDKYFENKYGSCIWLCLIGFLIAAGAMMFSIKWGM